MGTWPVQDAKAGFSEFLDRCLAEGPQIVTRRGERTAVLVTLKEWQRLQAAARPTLKDLLMAPAPGTETLVALARGHARQRQPPALG